MGYRHQGSIAVFHRTNERKILADRRLVGGFHLSNGESRGQAPLNLRARPFSNASKEQIYPLLNQVLWPCEIAVRSTALHKTIMWSLTNSRRVIMYIDAMKMLTQTHDTA